MRGVGRDVRIDGARPSTTASPRWGRKALKLMRASVPDGSGWSADAGPAGLSLRDAKRP